MRNFYKVNEYSEKLPNPKSFPIRGADVMAIKDCPNSFADGFIVDLSVSDKDKERLEGKVTRWIGKSTIDQLIAGAARATILLSEPEYIYVYMSISYILLAPNIKPVGIQVKYYNYFRNHYKGCQFYTNGQSMSIKSVKLGNKIVGLWMPVVLPPDKIKEERQK